MNARAQRLAVVTSVTLWFGTGPFAHAGVLQDLVSGNGGADPFNKNNNLGIVIKMPQAPPPTPSTMNDPQGSPQHYTLRVDRWGNVTKQIYGQPPILISKIHWKEWPNGVTYFQLPNQKPVTADPSLWDHVRIDQLNQQAAALKAYQQEQQQVAAAKKQIADLEQTIENTPYDQVVAQVQQLPNQQLYEARVRLDILTQVIRTDHLGDTTGFDRLLLVLNDEAARRKNLQQSQQFPQQPNPFPPGAGGNDGPSVGVFPPGSGGSMPPPVPPGIGLNNPSPAQPNGTFAANLGIYYTPVDAGNGTFAARLTGPPLPGSPAASIGLEAGDAIFELDGQRFDQPSDVLAHRFQTEIGFIDVRSNQEKHYNIYIP